MKSEIQTLEELLAVALHNDPASAEEKAQHLLSAMFSKAEALWRHRRMRNVLGLLRKAELLTRGPEDEFFGGAGCLLSERARRVARNRVFDMLKRYESDRVTFLRVEPWDVPVIECEAPQGEGGLSWSPRKFLLSDDEASDAPIDFPATPMAAEVATPTPIPQIEIAKAESSQNAADPSVSVNPVPADPSHPPPSQPGPGAAPEPTEEGLAAGGSPSPRLGRKRRRPKSCRARHKVSSPPRRPELPPKATFQQRRAYYAALRLWKMDGEAVRGNERRTQSPPVVE
eukprot:gene5326-8132_t